MPHPTILLIPHCILFVLLALSIFLYCGPAQQEFTSAGGENVWETFTLSDTALYDLEIAGVSGKHAAQPL